MGVESGKLQDINKNIETGVQVSIHKTLKKLDPKCQFLIKYQFGIL